MLLFFVGFSFGQANPFVIVKQGLPNQKLEAQGAMGGKLAFMLPVMDTLNNKSVRHLYLSRIIQFTYGCLSYICLCRFTRAGHQSF